MRPLYYRSTINNSDVANALGEMVGDGSGLPMAFTIDDVAHRLVEVAQRRDDGTVDIASPNMRRSTFENYKNKLYNRKTVFQVGYRKYEEHSHFPVVPVVDYFFDQIYAEGDLLEALGGMSDIDVRYSLPKPLSRIKLGDGQDDQGRLVVDYLKDENGNALQYGGKIVGVVIFPPNAQFLLLRSWLEKYNSLACGAMDAHIQRLENARPESQPVQHIKQRMRGLPVAMQRALPRVRGRE